MSLGCPPPRPPPPQVSVLERLNPGAAYLTRVHRLNEFARAGQLVFRDRCLLVSCPVLHARGWLLCLAIVRRWRAALVRAPLAGAAACCQHPAARCVCRRGFGPRPALRGPPSHAPSAWPRRSPRTSPTPSTASSPQPLSCPRCAAPRTPLRSAAAAWWRTCSSCSPGARPGARAPAGGCAESKAAVLGGFPGT